VLLPTKKQKIDNNGERREENVEPLTNYFVGRVQKDFNKGKTILGGMITAVNRDITNPDMNYLHTEAYTGGIDFEHNWKERTWYVASNSTFSNVLGSKEAILEHKPLRPGIFSDPMPIIYRLIPTLLHLKAMALLLGLENGVKKEYNFKPV
jgi:hypothetical protein